MSKRQGVQRTPHQRARRAVLQTLESWHAAGVEQVRAMAGTAVASDAPGAERNRPAAESDARSATAENDVETAMPSKSASPDSKASVAGPGRSLFDSADSSRPKFSLEQRCAALDAAKREVAACTRCAELVANRTQTVFGVGDPQARLCFLGEAPGADEDKQGEPFVGRAGQLLNRIIEACGLRREDVYILNILKCRPPNNRAPTPQEAANCRDFLDRQLEAISPEFICCLGGVAATNLLDTTQSIGKMRGRFYDYRGSKVIVTYHPAYLLRNPAAKRDVWEDMKLLLVEMGLEVPPR